MLRRMPLIAMLFGLGISIFCGYAFAKSTISGVISYSGLKTGDIYVGAFDEKYSLISCYGAKITSPGSYTLEVEEGRWFVKAFMDAAGNGPPTTGSLTPREGILTASLLMDQEF